MVGKVCLVRQIKVSQMATLPRRDIPTSENFLYIYVFFIKGQHFRAARVSSVSQNN